MGIILWRFALTFKLILDGVIANEGKNENDSQDNDWIDQTDSVKLEDQLAVVRVWTIHEDE